MIVYTKKGKGLHVPEFNNWGSAESPKYAFDDDTSTFICLGKLENVTKELKIEIQGGFEIIIRYEQGTNSVNRRIYKVVEGVESQITAAIIPVSDPAFGKVHAISFYLQNSFNWTQPQPIATDFWFAIAVDGFANRNFIYQKENEYETWQASFHASFDSAIPNSSTFNGSLITPLLPLYTTNRIGRPTTFITYDEFTHGGEALEKPDPYKPGEEPDEPVEPTFEDPSDPVPVPALPSLEVTDSGFVNLYTPTLQQVKLFAGWLWGDSSLIDDIQKLFNEPMDAIIGLSMLPLSIPSGGAVNLKLGNISSGVQVNKALNQFIEHDCGIINISRYYGSALDFSPFVKGQIYLPFIGIQQIDLNEFQGKNLGVIYHIDILTGNCMSFVTCEGNVKYTYTGNCITNIPINGKDYINTIRAGISIATTAGGVLATAGTALAPLAVGAASQSIANGVLSSSPTIKKSGGISGGAALLANRNPFVIIERPRQSVPDNANAFYGYPSNKTELLGNLSGFTQIADIHLSITGATQAELNEIENLLKAGVEL